MATKGSDHKSQSPLVANTMPMGDPEHPWACTHVASMYNSDISAGQKELKSSHWSSSYFTSSHSCSFSNNWRFKDPLLNWTINHSSNVVLLSEIFLGSRLTLRNWEKFPFPRSVQPICCGNSDQLRDLCFPNSEPFVFKVAYSLVLEIRT